MRGKHPVVYTPTKTREWEHLIKLVAQGKVKTLMTGPLEIDVSFFLPRPKSLPKKIAYHTKRPDLDNLLKSVLDALNGVVFKDDSQVVAIQAYKYYVLPHLAVPHITIIASELGGGR